MTRRQRRTSWGRTLAKQSESNLSATAFCHRYRLNLRQFYRWRRRLRDEHTEQTIASGFLELVPSSPRGHSGIRIRLGPELLIEVDRDFDPSTLRAVVNSLGRQEAGPWLV